MEQVAFTSHQVLNVGESFNGLGYGATNAKRFMNKAKTTKAVIEILYCFAYVIGWTIVVIATLPWSLIYLWWAGSRDRQEEILEELRIANKLRSLRQMDSQGRYERPSV